MGIFLFSSTIGAADFEGIWKGTALGPDGNPMEIFYEFDLTGKNLEGYVLTKLGGGSFSGGKIDGDNISFFVETPELTIYENGTLSDDVINMTQKKGDDVAQFTLKRFTQGTGTVDITGTWTGLINKPILKIYRSSKGLLFYSTLDVPEQGLKNISFDKTEFKDGKLHLELRPVNLSFDGVINAEGTEIFGKIKQNGTRPLLLKKTGKTELLTKNRILSTFAEQIAEDVKEDNLGCITAAVIKDGEIIWKKAFGLADKDKNIPAVAETIGRTGSISKSFTAVLMMVLAEKGIISLDDPVEKYLPEINQLADRPDEAEKITFRHLASHTAGIIREPKLQDAASGPIGQWTDKILMSIPKTSYKSLPGMEFSYSNIGYGILGYALERAANKRLIQMMEEYIFKPLKMENTAFILTSEQSKILSTGYANRPDGSFNSEIPAKEHLGRGYKVPNGGIYSNVTDMANFLYALTDIHGYRILSKKSLDEMFKVQTPDSRQGLYGLGFFIFKNPNKVNLIGHGGSVAGYTAYMVFDPHLKSGVVLFRNYNIGKTNLQMASMNLLNMLNKVAFVEQSITK